MNENNSNPLPQLKRNSIKSSLSNKSTKLFKKSQIILIQKKYLLRDCFYKGQFYNSYRGLLIPLTNQLKVNDDKKSDYQGNGQIEGETTQKDLNQSNAISRIYNQKAIIIKMTSQLSELFSYESKILKQLNEVKCIPKCIWRGEEKIGSQNYFVQVQEQMGANLKMNFQLLRFQINVECVCLIAINLLNAIEELHKASIVHRNLKPRKILFDSNIEDNKIYIIDFKYAKKFKQTKNQNIKYTESHRIHNKAFINKFSSIGTHMGITPSFKDDLESIGYILIYLLKQGKLWKIKNKHFSTKDEKQKFYEEEKLKLLPEQLSQDKIPLEIINYLNFVKNLNLTESVDYEELRKLFKKFLQKQKLQYNQMHYDWNVIIRMHLHKGEPQILNQNEIDNEQESNSQNTQKQNTNIYLQKQRDTKHSDETNEIKNDHSNEFFMTNNNTQQQINGNQNKTNDSLNTTISINMEQYDDEIINAPDDQKVGLLLNQNTPFKFKTKSSIFKSIEDQCRMSISNNNLNSNNLYKIRIEHFADKKQ